MGRELGSWFFFRFCFGIFGCFCGIFFFRFSVFIYVESYFRGILRFFCLRIIVSESLEWVRVLGVELSRVVVFIIERKVGR